MSNRCTDYCNEDEPPPQHEICKKFKKSKNFEKKYADKFGGYKIKDGDEDVLCHYRNGDFGWCPVRSRIRLVLSSCNDLDRS